MPTPLEWTVYPHGELRQVRERLWFLQGSLAIAAPIGPPRPRTMVVYRYADDRLLLCGPICPDEATVTQLESLGEPSMLLIPSAFHREQAPAYKARYPDAQVIGSQACRERIEKLISLDADAEAALAGIGGACLRPAGVKSYVEPAYRLELDDGTALVFGDLLFNLTHQPGPWGLIMRLIGSTAGFRMSNLLRLLWVEDRAAFSDWLLELAETPDLRAIAVCHGEPITERCADRLREAAQRLR